MAAARLLKMQCLPHSRLGGMTPHLYGVSKRQRNYHVTARWHCRIAQLHPTAHSKPVSAPQSTSSAQNACSECGAQFTSGNKLFAHLRASHGVAAGPAHLLGTMLPVLICWLLGGNAGSCIRVDQHHLRHLHSFGAVCACNCHWFHWRQTNRPSPDQPSPAEHFESRCLNTHP